MLIRVFITEIKLCFLQKKNSEGYAALAISDENRIRRFLILGEPHFILIFVNALMGSKKVLFEHGNNSSRIRREYGMIVLFAFGEVEPTNACPLVESYPNASRRLESGMNLCDEYGISRYVIHSGATGGTFYAKEQKLTMENVQALKEIIIRGRLIFDLKTSIF